MVTLSPLNTTGLKAHPREGRQVAWTAKGTTEHCDKHHLTDCFQDGSKAPALFYDCIWPHVSLTPATSGDQFHEKTLNSQVPSISLW